MIRLGFPSFQRSRRLAMTATVSAALALPLLAGCERKAPAPPPVPRKIPVTFVQPESRSIEDAAVLDGIVAPSASTDLVARVPGFLMQARFKDGDTVRKGQLLFLIEQDTYRQQVALNQARLDQARAEFQRQQSLIKENATSQASVENASSQLGQAEANLKLAQINLDYTEVRAPFDGVIGKRKVDVGSYVGSGAGTVLATVARLQPAYVNFSINETDLLRIRSHARVNGGPRAAVGKVPVRAALQGETGYPRTGVLDFIDYTLNASTGSIQLRASFQNRDLSLIPGLYARVSIDTGPPRPALLLPVASIQSDQQGPFVYVLESGDIVRRRSIVPGAKFDSMREVVSGVKADDRVVLDGIVNIRDGTPTLPKAAATTTGQARK
jgi:membrane fusion protein, multidrug efflux system